jgi:hypothetical protein
MNDAEIILKSFAVLETTYKRYIFWKDKKIQIRVAKKCVITKCGFPSGIGFHCVGKHNNACCTQVCFNLPFLGHYIDKC